MKFMELNIQGAFLIELEEYTDERGSFSRQFCRKEFSLHGIDFEVKQCNISRNYKKGVLRGLHYQKEPYPEAKLVSCLTGKCKDVIIDLRKSSPTYLAWTSNILSGNDNFVLYIPPNVAHGFLTLEKETTLYYQLGEYFVPEYYAGVRYDDPAFGIDWGNTDNIIINDRDKNYEFWK